MALCNGREIGERTLLRLTRGFPSFAIDPGGGILVLRLSLKKMHSPKLYLATDLASQVVVHTEDRQINFDDIAGGEGFPNNPSKFEVPLNGKRTGVLEVGKATLDYALDDSSLAVSVYSSVKPWVRWVRTSSSPIEVAVRYMGGFRFSSDR